MGRRPRAAALASAAALRSASTQQKIDDDESGTDAGQADVPREENQDDAATGTPAQESEGATQAEPEPEPPAEQYVPQPVVRRKRLGRPPKNRPPDWNKTPEPTEGEVIIPIKRRRGRPSTGVGGGSTRGGRGGRGGSSQVTRVPIDKEGNMMDVVNDEVALPEDPEGETKVDKNGNLLGGRDYRVRVFTITGRGERLYMLSTEPARCTGFRDSYLFFTKHMQLHKIIIDESEKYDLINRDIIPHSYKGRAIGVVTARSVFREFGARIVIGGRKVIDDYQVAAAKARGGEGELADPDDHLPPPGEPYNKNQYVAWHGASAVYHTGQPSVPTQVGKAPVKRKVNITSNNWMYEHSLAASRFNSQLAAFRRETMDGVYNPHTNQMHYPEITQPTHARWEEVPPPEEAKEPNGLPNGVTNGAQSHLTNGITSSVTNGEHPNANSAVGSPSATKTIFEPVPGVISRNFLITDTCMQSAPINNIGRSGLADVPLEVADCLPPQCRAAFEQAKAREIEWNEQWKSETEAGCRGKLKIGLTGHPV
ncbi:chromatin remodelling complex Rsc7/Swp82 subunit-domain-containing protein [Lineolata rhizophorae]|uniref:Chromatin remodelling complex Rsc7/Swp82 subunit-domain-containing protein n=1 Tax=Lineolata rhizophorae TaxID=578093 RepID=A0A6A6NPK4_9PEZI|nr:chromatin remodelling complex Rsc7/Swp82 subunit-domain-containing protein [Lineolata rhizophorae]